MPSDMVSQLCNYYNTYPEQNGEVFIACPFCGAESSKQHVHFSFSERGFHCFRCQASGPLSEMIEFVGIELAAKSRPRISAVKKTREWQWLKQASKYVSNWHGAQEALSVWRTYKPISDKAFEDYKLGLGKLPRFSSRCKHERLMVPIIVNNKVVGVRARQLSCSCEEAKWLSPGGSRMALFNGERLLHPLARGKRSELSGLAFTPTSAWARSKTLMIVENPIDAIMVEEYLGLQAVATLGVSIWKDDWTYELVNARPKLVICLYDHDVPGNGTDSKGEAEWLKTHDRLVVPNGVKLTKRLQDAGVNAIMFHWPDTSPLKSDVGDLVMRNFSSNVTGA